MKELRTAVPEDLEALTEIYNQAIRRGGCTGDLEEYTVAQRKGWYEEHSAAAYPLLVCEREGAIAGYGTLSAYRPGRQAFLEVREVSYYVEETRQRQGIGELLLRGLIREAEELRLRVLLAIILERNTASKGLLEKCGFTLCGRLPEIARLRDGLCGHLYYELQL